MKRITLVRDGLSEQTFPLEAYPLAVGGSGEAIPLLPRQEVAAYIGQEQGHPFIQTVEDGPDVWHNHERLNEPAWLKSGDQIQIGDRLIDWQVQGDRIVATLLSADSVVGAPSSSPPAAREAGHLPMPPLVPPRAANRTTRWLILLLFMGLTLAALFVLLATPVILTIQPQPRHLSLHGALPIVALPGRMLALPGDYTLIAEEPGYVRFEKAVSIAFGEAYSLDVKLEKLPGLISVQSTPQGIAVTIDGKSIGKTPVTDYQLNAGTHSLLLEAPRYQSRQIVLEVEGMGRRQSLQLEMSPDWAPVELITEPPGAEIREQERTLGRTPATLELMEGEHLLEFELAGFRTHRQSLSVEAGVPQEVPPIKLAAADGTVQLTTSPAGATISVDGSYQGLSPLELTLSPDQAHLIKITKAGFQPLEHRLEITAEETRAVELQLEPLFGVLFITSEPADATLRVDGQSRGKATGRFRLPARPHRIEIDKPGYKSYRGDIEINPGGSHNIEVTLEREAAGTKPGKQQAGRPAPKGASLVRINPSGSFTMGASRREPGRRANENLRQVTLSRPFLLGNREVTNGEYRRFRPGHDSGQIAGVTLNGEHQPVVNVTWEDAARYLNWLSRKASLPEAYREEGGTMVLVRPVNSGYRLPSEAEWEWAARNPVAGNLKKFPWPGDRPVPPAAWGNYADSSAAGILSIYLEGYNDGYPASAPVGSFAANELGIHDLDGNVAEWAQDYYAVHPGSGSTVAKDPMGPERGRHHVVRGSGWRDSSLSELRLSYRDYSDKTRNDLGFRVARYLN